MDTTFWQKNKVFITGIITAVLTALAPLVLQSQIVEWKAAVIAVAIAVGGYVGNEARGKGWTMGTQISAAILALSTGLNQDLTLFQLGFFILLSFIGIPIPPTKPDSYETSPTIQQAHAEADAIKTVEKATPPPEV
jgi:hypothetical protein